MTKETDITERLEQIVKQAAGKVSRKVAPIPEVAIKGTGYILCYHPSKRAFIRVSRGTKAHIVKEEENNRVLIYTYSGLVVEIDADELIDTGFD
jgi:hypothetical protein